MGAALDLCILGPLEVRVDGGEPIALGGLRQRALLAVLVLHANEAVATDRLVDELWGERPPATAAHTIQVFISRLRGALGAGSSRLVTRRPGYILEVKVDELDCDRCADLYARGRAALGIGDAPRAAGLLQEAQALWRGSPLSEFTYEPFAHAPIARLEELRLACREELIEAELTLGHHARLVADLEALVREHPFRERPRGQLMLALYRCGRQADALDAFRQARRALLDELGVEPTAALRALEQAILCQDESLLTPAVLTQHTIQSPPDRLPALVLRLPEDRPQSAREAEQTLSEVLGDTSGRTPVAEPPGLPIALTGMAERPLVGREAALRGLRDGWLRAAAGRPSLRLVIGDPGIGKTRLAAAFAAEVVAKEGALVLHGRCDEEPLLSYQPFIEALRMLIRHQPRLDAAVDPRLLPELIELGRLVPELRHVTASDDAPIARESERSLLFETIVALLTAGAAGCPLLLVLDDLHWADKPTVLLLRQLLRSSSATMMVLVTTRPDGLKPDCPLSSLNTDLHREDDSSRLERIVLEGLDEIQTAALVAAREARPIDDEFFAVLHEETGGNPFFIEEVMRALRGADLSTASEATSALHSVGVPEGARGVIQRRLAQLTPEAVELLTRASVCGREFRLPVAAELVGKPVTRLLGPLDEAVASGLVIEHVVDTFSFCHALARDALYFGIPSDTHRARLHLAAGQALEALGDGAVASSELSFHFHAARAVGGAQKAAVYAHAAAAAAVSALSYEEAANHTARELDALEVLGSDHDRERARRLNALGRLHWQAGDRAAAQVTFLREAELARQLDDPLELARAALGLGGRYYDAEQADDVLPSLLEEALAALPPRDDGVRAELMSRLANALHFTDPEGRAVNLSAEALAMARRTGERPALLSALSARHSVLGHAAHIRERQAISAEWLAIALELGHQDQTAVALTWRIYDLIESNEADAARHTHAKLIDLAERLRQPQYQNFATSWEFNWLQLAGRFSEGERKAMECYRYARRAQGTYAESLYAGQLFALRHDQGRLGELAEAVTPLVGTDPRLSAWRAAMPLIHATAGDPDHAQGLLSDLAEDDFAAIPVDGFWLGAMCLLSEGCAVLGDAQVAAGLARHLKPYALLNAQVGLAFCLGPVHRFLGLMTGLIDEFDTAEGHFVAAIERSIQLGAATTEAHARCDYGELLLRARRDDARRQLEHARVIADRLGMMTVERRASDALTGLASVSERASYRRAVVRTPR